MKRQVLAHFKKVDPVLYEAGKAVGFSDGNFYSKSRSHFENLCREITGQQLSGKAASTIYRRFKKLFPGGKVEPELVLAMSDQEICDVGMSWAKVKYVKDLAQKVVELELDLGGLGELADAEVIAELTKVKGIGKWTAEMYLMFSLEREDVFSHGDLGLKRAIEKLYGLCGPTIDQVEAIVGKWSPYRTWGCLVLWKTIDGD